MSDIFNRFKEPSSWAGIVGLIAVVLPNLNSGLVAAGVTVLAAISGFLAVVLAEKK